MFEKNYVKVANKNVGKKPMAGNYLCIDKKGNLLFAKNFAHSLFLVDSSKNIEEKPEQSISFSFEKYFLDLCDICGAVSNKPSIVQVNSITPNNMFMDLLGGSYTYYTDPEEIVNLNNGAGVYSVTKQDEVDEFFEILFNSRSNQIPTNNIFVVLEHPEDWEIKNLANLLTVARSRRIFFIIFIEDVNAFNNNYADELEIIKANCKINYTCNNANILNVTIPSFKKNQSTETLPVNLANN